MQIIVPSESGPEHYESSGAYRLTKPPCRCPNCESERRLRLLGYYQRVVSSELSGRAVSVHVRRFRCRDCGRTTSLLPWFAQPYRLVRNAVIGEYLRECGIDSRELRWQGLLVRYRRRFLWWLPELDGPLRREFGLAKVSSRPSSAWRDIELRLGGIDLCTALMAAIARMTIFGRYKCHLPKGFPSYSKHDHTTLVFASGTDPPE